MVYLLHVLVSSRGLVYLTTFPAPLSPGPDEWWSDDDDGDDDDDDDDDDDGDGDSSEEVEPSGTISMVEGSGRFCLNTLATTTEEISRERGG